MKEGFQITTTNNEGCYRRLNDTEILSYFCEIRSIMFLLPILVKKQLISFCLYGMSFSPFH